MLTKRILRYCLADKSHGNAKSYFLRKKKKKKKKKPSGMLSAAISLTALKVKGQVVEHTTCVLLTLKATSKICIRQHSKFVFHRK